MNDLLIKLGLRSQIPLGVIQFLLIFISVFPISGILPGTNDREAFSCIPKTNTFTKQLCYDKYTSTLNPWFAPLYFVVITYAVLLVCQIFFVVYAHQYDPSRKSAKFRKAYLIHVFFRLIFIGVMIGLFCSHTTLSAPSMFKCSLTTNTIPTPFNQTETDLHCHDQHYKEKSNLNTAIIVIKAFVMILCMIELIRVMTLTPDELRRRLLQDVAGNNERNAAKCFETVILIVLVFLFSPLFQHVSFSLVFPHFYFHFHIYIFSFPIINLPIFNFLFIILVSIFMQTTISPRLSASSVKRERKKKKWPREIVWTGLSISQVRIGNIKFEQKRRAVSPKSFPVSPISTKDSTPAR